jgi:hypothetical protein
MTERIDRRLDRLPGQGGLHLATRVADRLGAEKASAAAVRRQGQPPAGLSEHSESAPKRRR